MWVAEEGGGVTCNDERVPRRPEPQAPWTAAVPRNLYRPEAPGFRFVRRRGACAVDYVRLAEGFLDVLGYTTANPWDHLAGSLIVSELGGAVSHGGRTYRAGTSGPFLLAAASPGLAELALQRLPQGEEAEIREASGGACRAGRHCAQLSTRTAVQSGRNPRPGHESVAFAASWSSTPCL